MFYGKEIIYKWKYLFYVNKTADRQSSNQNLEIKLDTLTELSSFRIGAQINAYIVFAIKPKVQ